MGHIIYIYRPCIIIDHRWLGIRMLTVSTSFPLYASQVSCQGLNLRKCIKTIYNAGKACLFPFLSQELGKK